MLKNYLKIAFRNIRKRKGYSFITIAGLGIGIAASLLIALYALNILTYDRFHEHADDLYMVYKERVTPSGTQETYDTWVPLKTEMEETFPGVTGAARTYTRNVWMESEGKRFQESVMYTDRELFDLFTFPLKAGDGANPFPSLQSMVISGDIAKKYFGNENPVGKVFRLAYSRDYVVSGVLEEIPQNSSIQIDMAILLESAGGYEDLKENWSTSFLNTYIRLREGTQPPELEAQFPAFITTIWDAEVAERTNFRLLPVTAMYDRFNNSNRYAYILLAIAGAILLIACINFMNMATARSLERLREVGMRKALGGMRSQLILQFLGEAVLTTMAALLIGAGLAEAALPLFNDLYGLELSLDYFGSVASVAVLALLGVVLGLVSGSYPAFFLSRFSSSEVLRGQSGGKPGGYALRRVLVTVQFAVTIVIIVSTLIMRRQIRYLKSADLGLQKENVVAIQRSADDFEDEEQAAGRLSAFKSEIARHRNVFSVASSRALPGRQFSFNSFTFVRPSVEGWSEESPLRMRYTYIDSHFFPLFEVGLVEGRNFIEGSEPDREGSVIINEAARDDFGWTASGAVGEKVRLGSSGDALFTVVGVADDYHYQSLENEVEPVIHFYRPPENGAHNFISVRIGPDDTGGTLAFLQEQWKRIVAADMPMNFTFVDEQFDRLYRTQDRLVTVAAAFSMVAILIACLGLLGLASLMVVHRTREIGIRKVLGAPVSGIVLLVSRDYVLLVLTGFLVAVPVAYYLMNRWLQDFAYRVDVGAGYFLLGGLLAVGVAAVTVSVQAFKAARMNPVESLRNE